MSDRLARRMGPALLALLLGCGNLAVEAGPVAGADFTGLESWAWAPETSRVSGGRLPDAVVDQRIRAVVGRGLEAAGYRQVDPGTADIWVGYEGEVVRRARTRELDPAGASPWVTGPARGSLLDGEPGTLRLTAVRRVTGQVLWSGTARATVMAGDSDAERLVRIEEAARRMIAEFPKR